MLKLTLIALGGGLRLSEDLPMVVEIIDRRDPIDRLLEQLEGMMSQGLATLEQVEVIWYRPGQGEDRPSASDGPAV